MENATEQALFRRILSDNAATLLLEQGLINIRKPGHTRDGAKVKEAHCGPTTANYYVGMTLAGQLDAAKADQMLDGLTSLQITGEHAHTGGFYWYREEQDFHDSNAAFFILSPLVILLLKRQSVIDDVQLQRLDHLLAGACGWFLQEVSQPKLYYPNKILSDGALLLAIAKRIGDEAAYAAGIGFFRTWLAYTAQRGWGWGENLSLPYIRICLNALRIASLSLREADEALRAELEAIIDYLLETVRFHEGREFVPTIRSYNFSGEEEPHSLLWWLAGVYEDQGEMQASIQQVPEALTLLLFEEEWKTIRRTKLPIPRERSQRIFDKVKAYSWIGHTARLGSVERFPVIAGSYQWPTWGLGWQSMPVAAVVEGEQMSYLRWRVDDGEQLRTHPAHDKARAYLSSALFAESPLPAIHQHAAQQGSCLLTVRSISRLHHQAREIADEWLVHRFTAEVATAYDAGGHPWTVLLYPDTIILLAAIGTRDVSGTVISQPQLQSVREVQADGSVTLSLRQILYAAESRRLQSERIEAGWAIVILDGMRDIAEATAWLEERRLTVAVEWDSEVPREFDHLQRRIFRLSHGEEQVVTLTVDPYVEAQIPY